MRVLLKKDSRWSLPTKDVKRVALGVMEEMGFPDNAELSVMLAGKRKAKSLNLQYRKMSYVPQVLAFSQDREKGSEGMLLLGDVVICLPLLREEAIRENRLIMEVLRDWLRHGVGNLR